ncbi:MAG: aminotransferase class V-fold PLP-dependent enzyme, partial [bacterium]|nr:aminotransferase class V-fold PLP-dependent enzyme [bacterium]
VRKALRKNTVFVSIGLVNGEIGTVQPIHAIAKIVREFSAPSTKRVPSTKWGGAVLHTDACQGMYVPLQPHGLGVDLLTLDSGKMYGPRGAGALYVKHGTPLAPIMFGGSQEGGMRPGTENTMLAAGFAAALARAVRVRRQKAARLDTLRRELIAAIQADIQDAVVNGTAREQSPHIVNISIPDIGAEYIVMYMDERGVALSTKSACLEKKDASESHVVAALKVVPSAGGWRKENTLRFSLGAQTTRRDITAAAKLLKKAIEKYRSFHS